jgi:hypothetical protein
MFNTRSLTLAFGLVLAVSSFAQWSDRKLVGEGGESCVSADGSGSVYVAMHQPGTLYASHDWGTTFEKIKTFDEAFCDMDVLAWPNGNLNVEFIVQGENGAPSKGFASYFSTDKAATLQKGSAPTGTLDREWMAPNPTNGEIYMDYSNGFIGGPKSVGVFLAASTNHGATFQNRSRIDKEPAGEGPIDPYLCSSSDGRIYAMWSTTHDQNLIDRFDFAYSTDGGRTFQGHQTIGALDPKLGDTQERWILGCIVATGPKTVVALYPNYTKMVVDGVVSHPLLDYYRVSTDGGNTFSPPKLLSPQRELEDNIRSFQAHKHSDKNVAIYVQTLPWFCSDSKGRIYVAYQDDRDGQVAVGDQSEYLCKWHVRFAGMESLAAGFSTSERVSDDVVCYRPPLDFLCCTTDPKNAYVTWTEHAGTTAEWAFSGNTYIAKKPLGAFWLDKRGS